MMEARELRIGNLVEYRIADKLDERKEWWEVSEIDADDILWLSKVDSNDENFRPIPLTEEWLLKFGFKKEEDFFDGEYIFSKTTNEICLQISFNSEKIYFVDSLWKIELKHVHRFQNLYFELTGKELEIC